MKKNILFIFETVYRLSINRSFKLALDNINMKVIISCLNNYFYSLISVRIFFLKTHTCFQLHFGIEISYLTDDISTCCIGQKFRMDSLQFLKINCYVISHDWKFRFPISKITDRSSDDNEWEKVFSYTREISANYLIP